jgi:hypothetical protein
MILDFHTKYSSQFLSDGITESLIKELWGHDCYKKNAFEIGVSPTENNTKFLKDKYSWAVTQVDGAYSVPHEKIYQHFITKENVVGIMKSYDTPRNLNLFSIDIDGNDVWVLHEVLKHYTADIVIAEYNVSFGTEDKVMPYDSQAVWSGDNYYGASITSWKKLMDYHGYYFVTCDKEGVNCFFTNHKLNIENGLDFTNGNVGRWPECGKPMTTIDSVLNINKKEIYICQ